MANRLPPLPKPSSVSLTNSDPGSIELRDNYTADQMRDYVEADRSLRQVNPYLDVMKQALSAIQSDNQLGLIRAVVDLTASINNSQAAVANETSAEEPARGAGLAKEGDLSVWTKVSEGALEFAKAEGLALVQLKAGRSKPSVIQRACLQLFGRPGILPERRLNKGKIV